MEWAATFSGLRTQGDAHFQKLAGSVFADAMPKPHHGGFVHGELMLEDDFAAEVLPVRIFHPEIQNITIRQRVRVFEQL